MNFSEFFIRRPIATSLLMLGIAMFGIVAYRALPVSDMPNVDFPTINVGASLPGADPATMASAVATPLERQFTGIAGLDSMTSSSSTGSTSITLQFDLDRKIDGATVDVETAISAATPLLPPGIPSPPSFRKQNPADSPIMFLGLTSKTLPMYKLDEYAETLVAQRVSMVNGVAQVNVMGAQKYAVHVQVDPRKLATRRIGIDEVASAIQGWNSNLPTGTLYGPHTAYNVEANGQLMDATDFRPMVVAWRNGSPIRLQDVANVLDSVEDDKNTSWLIYPHEQFKAINLMIMRQPGSNTIEVTDAIKKLIPTFQAQLPPAVNLTIRGDRSKNIREAFQDIQYTMMITLALVIGVIFVFLRNVSATFIPAMALPFSIVGTFAVMYTLSYSLDNLSMMALILSVGFVVDDAIVMLENIMRHVEKGEAPMQAALRGSREISFTIISMTISLAAVFIPLLFMGGILGRLFREFAVTICVAILISGFVSVTLTPMLCSRLLRAHRARKRPNFAARAVEGFFVRLNRGYDWSLTWVLRHRPVMGVVFLTVVAATVFLYFKVQKGFIPETDNDQVYVTTEAAQGTSYAEMLRLQERINKVFQQDPNVETFMSSVGGGWGGGGSSTARIFLQLKPRRQRTLTAAQVAEKLRPKVSGFPGMRVFMTVPPAIRIGGHSSKSSYELTVSAPDTTRLYAETDKLMRLVAKLPEVQDVTTDLQMKSPRILLEIDRDKAAALQLNAQQIEGALYDGFGPSWVSTIYAPTTQYRVLLELDPKYQAHADSLSDIYLKSSTGALVPLSAIVKQKQDAGPQSINHSGQLPSVSISFNLKPGVSLGEAVTAIGTLARHTLPGDFATSFTGTAKAFQSSLSNMGLLLILAIAVVYIVLGVLYESYIHPLTILSGIPAAGFGALLTLIIFDVDLNIYSFVGLIMLIGIVKKNAIMQIDFALAAERNEGKTPEEAIHEGCLVRFRPILMTSMAAMLGALPMALGYGAGGEARRPLGVAVVGGLVFSQLITLYLTPVVYTYMAALQRKRSKTKQAKPEFPAAPAHEPVGVLP
ncbi:MAG: efflux RND transporter permease subunit [Acidobacteriota bacterium]|nr:efflux RND transporter permease subunit [Acidobacteriota bacterium]